MKKILYSFAALALLALVSCEKEIDNTIDENPVNTVTGNVMTIEARMSKESTKTNYDSDGKFTWVSTDQIIVIAHVDGNANNQKSFTFTTSAGNITEEGRAATFTGSVDDGYVADYAAYPISLASNNPGSGYNAPFVKVPSNVSGEISSAMLIGISDGAGGYTFNTAMSLFKINISGVPASASKIRLVTSDKENYPLDGDFTLVESEGVVTLDFAHYHSEWSAYDKGYLNVDISARGAISGEDFYFNVPVGTYPARTLSIQVLDGSDNVMSERVITKALTTNRNELLTLPALTMDCWETLGTGKFIDNFLWNKVYYRNNAEVDKDALGYVDVIIQQNIANNKKYRLVHPYANKAAQLGYTLSENDEYLVFTLDGSSVAGFDTHKTGVRLDYYQRNEKIEFVSSAENKILAGTDTAPIIVQLAPKYTYVDVDSSYDKSGEKNMIRIIFPGVANLDASFTPTGDATLNGINVAVATNSSVANIQTRVVISQYNDTQIASGLYSLNCNSDGGYPNPRANYTSNTSFNWSANASLTALPSGPVYICWFTRNSTTLDVYSQGSLKVYYVNPTDKAKYVKSHTFHYGETTEAGAWKYGTIEFALSDDPTKGQLILKDVDGMTSVAANTRLAADHPLWTAMGTWLAHGDGAYAYSDDRVTDGNTYYGIINNSRLSFAANTGYEFFNYSVDGVAGHTAKIIIFSNDGKTSDAPAELAFTISADKLTLAHDYLVARWIGYFWNGSTVTNSGGWASKPLAQKDGDNRPYISLE